MMMFHMNNLYLLINMAYLVKDTSALYLVEVPTIFCFFSFAFFKKKSLELATMRSI